MAQDAQNVIDAVIDNKLYIGNLTAALSLNLRSSLGITHIVSVCPEYPSTGPNHLALPVQDSEYQDLLIHLPEVCSFIQSALDRQGKVLVHCVMGVSRSATVVCAYCRPQVHPNYGFMKQLHVFAECRYKPSTSNGDYISWKRRQKRDVTRYLNMITDTVPVVRDHLYLNTEFPSDPETAESLLSDMGITHVLSLSSAQFRLPLLPLFNHRHIDIPNHAREALLLEIPTACKYIDDAIASGGQVLVHCRVELRACIVVCGYLMSTRHKSPREAFAELENALPLFNPTRTFYRHLELYEACNYAPTTSHPLVKAWVAEIAASQAEDTHKSLISMKNDPFMSMSKTTDRMVTVTTKPLDAMAFNEAVSRLQMQTPVHG